MDRPSRASLLFVNQHYAPDVAATGQCLADLAEHLVRADYDVEVLASRAGYGADAVDAPARELVGGVKVHRVATTTFGRTTRLGRLIDYASFYVAVLFKLLFARRYDGVVFLTTPPLVAFAGRVALALRGQRYGIWSMDLHPEAEIAAGMVRERSVLGRLLRWLDGTAYRGADFVVGLGEHMRQRILKKGVPEAQAHTVNIWGGPDGITPSRGVNPITQHLALDDRFVVMYSGNAGIVHEFGPICEAMRELRDDPRIFFLFVGGGARRAEVEAFANRERLSNFEYRDYFPRELLRDSLTVADVHLISLRQAFVGVSVPSKLYGAMASARPILFVGPNACETADAIHEARCGVVIDPADGNDVAAGKRVANVLRAWADCPAVREELGARGHCAFVERYDHRLSCAAFEGVVHSVWGTRIRAREVPYAHPRPVRTETPSEARAS